MAPDAPKTREERRTAPHSGSGWNLAPYLLAADVNALLC